MRRDNTNVAKEETTMKRGGPRGRPRLSWMDRVRSDMKEHQLESRSKARTEHRSMEKCSHCDRPRKGIRSAKVSQGEQSCKVPIRSITATWLSLNENIIARQNSTYRRLEVAGSDDEIVEDCVDLGGETENVGQLLRGRTQILGPLQQHLNETTAIIRSQGDQFLEI